MRNNWLIILKVQMAKSVFYYDAKRINLWVR